MLGLYIHIPFCSSICPYCDFPKKIKKDNYQVREYINLLIKELTLYESYFKDIDTIYIGGGTPNYLSLADLEILFKNLTSIKAKEFSIECNIEHLTLDQVLLFKKYNVTRISIGVQTLNKKGIKLLNRHHNVKLVNSKFSFLRKYFTNVSFDFIYGYPHQTLKDLRYDLRYVKKLKVKHVSFYNLIIEENTLFYKKYNDFTRSDDLEARMNQLIVKRLNKYGLKQYEFSNFSFVGFESRHNLKYWEKEEYIGIGLGATSYLNSKRITNPKLYYEYVRGYKPYIEELTEADEKKEYLLLGLRKIIGVNLSKYYLRFKTQLLDDFKLEKSFDLGFLNLNNDYLSLTSKGIFLSNFVFREILDTCFMN